MKNIFFFILCLLILWACSQGSSENFSIAKKYEHDSNCFTQWLEYYNGYLYESCGIYWESSIKKYTLWGTKIVLKHAEKKYFYEGLTIFQEKIYLLTWKSWEVHILNSENLEPLEIKKLPPQIQEGWGIANDGKHIYISNGTKNIFILNEILEIQDILNTDISNINELEYSNGKIYANVWKTAEVVIFSANTGEILAKQSFEDLAKVYNWEQVLNGITFWQNNNMLITGKQWSEMYEVTKKY